MEEESHYFGVLVCYVIQVFVLVRIEGLVDLRITKAPRKILDS